MNFGACPFPAGALVWAYLRYSTDEQNLDSQENYVRGWCEFHRVVLGAVFKDEAKSGTTTVGRTDFLRMMARLEADPQPRPQGIVFWDLKRWARNFDDSQYFKAHARRLGFVVHSLQDNIPNTRDGRVLESMRDWANELEALQRREDTKRGLHDLAAHGYTTGGFPPVGYKLSERIEIGRKKSGELRYAHRFEMDPETSGRVRLAWELKLAGKSHWEIHAATKLCANVRGYYDIFKRVTYAGAIKCGDVICWDAHPAYVSRSDWERVQAMRKPTRVRASDHAHSPARLKHNNAYLLSGVLRCGMCGWAMAGTTNRSQRYYRCDWRHRQGYKRVECKQPSLVAHVLHDALLEWMAHEVFTFEQLRTARERLNAEVSGTRRELFERRDFLQGEVRRLKQAMHYLLNAIERGGFVAEMQERWDARQIEMRQSEVELAELEAQIGAGELKLSDEALRYVAAHMQSWLMEAKTEDVTEIRRMVKLVVKKADLFEDKMVMYYSPLPFVEAVARAPQLATAEHARRRVLDSAAYAAPLHSQRFERIVGCPSSQPMQRNPTFQARLRLRDDDSFIGRSDLVALLQDALRADTPSFGILSIYGQGGVGKSTLLNRYRTIAKQLEIPAVLTNHEQTFVLDVLQTVSQQLAELGIVLKGLDAAFDNYRSLQLTLDKDPDFLALRAMPQQFSAAGTGQFDALLSKELHSGQNPQMRSTEPDTPDPFRRYVLAHFSGDSDRALLLSPIPTLTREFVRGLNGATERRILFLLDTFETTGAFLEEWLFGLLEGEYGEFGDHLFVVAGRSPLPQNWLKFRSSFKAVELNPFTEQEAREYLVRTGITDEERINRYLVLSQRLPVLLALLSSASPTSPSEHVSDVVERFLQNATLEQRRIALAACVTRRFNTDILAVLLGPIAPSALHWLTQAAFVTDAHGAWEFHPVVRSLMLVYFRQVSPEAALRSHQVLADFYRTQWEADREEEGRRASDLSPLALRAEQIYHSLFANPSDLNIVIEGLLHLNDGNLKSTDFQFYQTAGHTLVSAALQVAQELELRELQGIVEPFGKLFSLTTDQEEIRADVLLECCLPLTRRTTLTDGLRALAYLLCSDAYNLRGKTNDELDALNHAIELDGDHHDGYYLRGVLRARTGEYQKALGDLNEAIARDSRYGPHYYTRSLVYLDLKQTDLALADCNRAIELTPNNAWNYRVRGVIHRQLKDLMAARADLTRAIELEPKAARFYVERAFVHRRLKDQQAAIADFTSAIQLDSHSAWIYSQRGMQFNLQKEYASAVADLTHSLELEPDDRWTLHWLGANYYHLGQRELADENFAKALAVDPKPYTWFRRALNAMYWGRYVQCISNFTSGSLLFLQLSAQRKPLW